MFVRARPSDEDVNMMQDGNGQSAIPKDVDVQQSRRQSSNADTPTSVRSPSRDTDTADDSVTSVRAVLIVTPHYFFLICFHPI